MSSKKVLSRTSTIMFLDLANYTKTTANLTREKFNTLHDIFDELTIPHFSSFTGTIIKKIGDAYLVTFDSPTNAVLCGVEIQRSFAEYRVKNPKATRLNVRIAIHMGEVIVRESDVYGDAVNTTARIESIAKEDQIIVSQSIYEATNQNEIRLIPLGVFKLKGIRRPIRLYRVQTKGDLAKISKINHAKKQRRFQRSLINFLLFAGLCLITLLLGYYYLYG